MPQFGPLNWIVGYLAVVVGLITIFCVVWWAGLKPLPRRGISKGFFKK